MFLIAAAAINLKVTFLYLQINNFLRVYLISRKKAQFRVSEGIEWKRNCKRERSFVDRYVGKKEKKPGSRELLRQERML